MSNPSKSRMEVKFISWDEAMGFKDQWLALWSQQPRQEVFQHPAWTEAFVDAYECKSRVRLLVAQDGSRVAGIMLLVGSPQGKLEFLGAPRSDYNDAICDPSMAKEAAIALLRRLKEEGLADLEEIPEHGWLIEAARSLGWKLHIASECPAIVPGESAALWSELQNKQSVKRHEKKLQRLGEVRLRRFSNVKEMTTALKPLFAQHLARSMISGKQCMFADPAARRFYECLVQSPSFAPFLDFRSLELNGRPAAFHFGFCHNKRFIWYKPSFDSDLWDLGPGEVLLKHLFQAAKDEGWTEFDFTRGNEDFKSRFANIVRKNFTIKIGRPPLGETAVNLVSRALRFARRHAGKLRNKIPRAGSPLLFFRHTGSPTVQIHPEGLELRTGEIHLSELGWASLDHPEFLHVDRLQTALQRRKRGDLMLALWDKKTEKLASLGFIRQDTGQFVTTECRHPVTIPNGTTVQVIFDCWTAPEWRGRSLYPWILRECVRIGRERGLETWIYCTQSNVASARGILKAGFELALTTNGNGKARPLSSAVLAGGK